MEVLKCITPLILVIQVFSLLLSACLINASHQISSKVLLILSCYYNKLLQYSSMITSAIPPMDYSCKEIASLIISKWKLNEKSRQNSCKEKVGKSHPDLSVFSHHLVSLHTSAHFLQIRDFTGLGKCRIYRAFRRF